MTQQLSQDYWDKRYQDDETGWDLGVPSPPITNYVDQIKDKNIAILIPGCGNAYEAEALYEKGFQNISLIDFSPTVVKKVQATLPESIQVHCEDFFKHQGNYDLILEQTFFCALHPELRSQYVDKMYSLLRENGTLAGVLFAQEFEKEGPPFGGTKAEYKTLFSKKFEILTLETCYNSVEPRKGSELFFEFKVKDK